MSEMTDGERLDLMTYGACWCGRARRQVLTTEDGVYDRPGTTTELSLVCYAGHDADAASNLTVKYEGIETRYVLASRLREADEEIRATREMIRSVEATLGLCKEEVRDLRAERDELLEQQAAHNRDATWIRAAEFEARLIEAEAALARLLACSGGVPDGPRETLVARIAEAREERRLAQDAARRTRGTAMSERKNTVEYWREWYLSKRSECQLLARAEDELRAENERLRSELHQATAEWFEETKRARELEAEVERLREALKRIVLHEDYAEEDMAIRRQWCTDTARRALRGSSDE